MSEAVCDFSVVGEHENAGGGFIKPADGINAGGALLDKVHYGLVCVGV